MNTRDDVHDRRRHRPITDWTSHRGFVRKSWTERYAGFAPTRLAFHARITPAFYRQYNSSSYQSITLLLRCHAKNGLYATDALIGGRRMFLHIQQAS